MKRTHIVAAIILNSAHDQAYITKRPEHVHKGGFWEFPGGKVEVGESSEQAMIRELQEEVGITVTQQRLFEHLEFDYSDKSLTFDFMLVTQFDGEPFGREGQEGRWISISQLDQYEFPEANIGIVKGVMKEFT
ncbi:8-oxo-dGTP diphosphatase MutT [Vibrio sp.]|uniref:8-oxo-dGTP diphosphatase n=1 Tax=Vibrio viridaestus TaxID=2487322 RepID=A0A3N9TFG1_9VIBR|nr:8-oxo-dGTP diphosphatase MutT [Vibrio viridaestus]MDC0609292.1 8-oxo-dGTP diphosphatase MutT [Vibrio sp.]RQW62977.1 8-oxo-dGTP diphosphatase MutT [Vibrio viridaestus]